MVKVKSEEKIIALLRKKEMSTVEEITQLTGFSRQYIHKLLDRLIDKGDVEKNGKTPHVFYRLVDIELKESIPTISLEN